MERYMQVRHRSYNIENRTFKQRKQAKTKFHVIVTTFVIIPNSKSLNLQNAGEYPGTALARTTLS